MASHLSIPRAELLIAPRDVADNPALAGILLTGPDADRAAEPLCFRGDSYEMVLASYGPFDNWSKLDTGSSVQLTEGWWPEPVGMAADFDMNPAREEWSVEPDRYGLRPIYYGFDAKKRPIASTRPEVVAALIGAELSTRSIAEQLLVGFNLNDSCPFEGVHRLCPGERFTFDDDQGPLLEERRFGDGNPTTSEAGPGHWLMGIQAVIADAFERGDALELSGGVDSRLVLAIGLHSGVKPRLAFTLGADDDDDVCLARQICARFAIEHLALPAVAHREHAADDGALFVARSGFAVNACSYAWLPNAFRQLAPHRTAQIGGGGGECAYGFYYSPFDRWCTIPAVTRMWIRKRLFHTGLAFADIFDTDQAADLMAMIEDDARAFFRLAEGPWRSRTDEFYLRQRVPNAGGAVLSASACWYRPIQPLLHRPYIEWGRTLGTHQRAGRRIQMDTIHQLNPELAAIPYSGGRVHASNLSSTIRRFTHYATTTCGKVSRRLRNRKISSDLGAATAAETLIRHGDTRRTLECLAEDSSLPINRPQVDAMMASPAANEYELGVLITAAWARDALTAVKERLSCRRTAPEARRAA